MELTNGDKIFKLLQGCMRNLSKPDLHSFVAKIKNGMVYVECRDGGEVFIKARKDDETVECWAGTVVAAANRLVAYGMIPESAEI